MSTLVLCVAALAILSWSTSLLVGAALPALARVRPRITGAAHARLVLTLVIAPVVLSTLALGVSLLPSLGLGHDHCPAHGLHHPHLCFTHATSGAGGLALGVSLAFALRLVVAAARAWCAAGHARRAMHRFAKGAAVRGRASVIDEEGSHAFVIGLLSPRVFVTRELVARVGPAELGAVLAHEEAHARRRDPLRRVLARLALACHVPGLSTRLDEELALAHELAADEHAAAVVGDGSLVAEAIVAIARRRRADRLAVAAWGGADLVARVQRLLVRAPRRDVPSLPALSAVVIVAVTFLAGAREQVHHALETALGLLA